MCINKEIYDNVLCNMTVEAEDHDLLLANYRSRKANDIFWRPEGWKNHCIDSTLCLKFCELEGLRAGEDQWITQAARCAVNSGFWVLHHAGTQQVGKAHVLWGEPSALLSSPTQNANLSRNTLTDKSRILVFYYHSTTPQAGYFRKVSLVLEVQGCDSSELLLTQF